MKAEWPELTLDEVSELIVDCPHSTPEWTDDGVIVLRNQYIRNGRLDLSNPSYTNEDGYQARVKRAIPTAGDLVITREAPMGEVCLIPKGVRCCLGQRMVLVRVNKKVIDPKYLLFVIQSPYLQHQISWNEGTGTTVSNIRIPTLKAFLIPLPPLDEQRTIANILGALDDKIELNRQMNESLEAMAQALFKSWFVDFDPVIDNALAAGNEIPEPLQKRAAARQALGDQRKPLPADIQSLFPDRFVFTDEMGWIPEGWEQTAISDVAKVIKGKSYKSAELSASQTALVTLKSFNRGGGYRLDGLKEYTGAYKTEQEVIVGDLVIAYTDVTQAADVIGKPAMVVSDERYEHLVISLDVAVVRPNKDQYKTFLYGLAQTEQFQQHTKSHSTGTTVLHLSKDAVPSYQFSAPDLRLVEAFDKQVNPLFRTIDLNISRNRTLEKVRNTLLPKLLSGELRIPEAEKQVAEAV